MAVERVFANDTLFILLLFCIVLRWKASPFLFTRGNYNCCRNGIEIRSLTSVDLIFFAEASLTFSPWNFLFVSISVTVMIEILTSYLAAQWGLR